MLKNLIWKKIIKFLKMKEQQINNKDEFVSIMIQLVKMKSAGKTR